VALLSDAAGPTFWLSLLEIIWINILLSGDNAVVIALACRALPPRERRWGMVIGAGGAAGLRVIFAGVVSMLMTLPYVKLVGALALVVIAAKLVVPEKQAEDAPEAAQNLWRAVQIVVLADVIMSLDNVIAIAAVAKGDFVLLALGLLISIPIVVAGSALMLALLERVPALVWGGAALLGWVAGDIFASDVAVLDHLNGLDAETVELIARIAGVALVIVIGALWRWQALRADAHASKR
jgi:YjbE family integral membrane protein